jgi:hypothetical protein
MSHVKVPFTAHSASNNLLNGGSGIEKLLGSHTLDTVKGLTTQKYLCSTELQSRDCASGWEIQR